jgi:hypothetical protein
MIEHVWSILCSASIIDSNSNNVSLINVVEQLTLSPDASFPLEIMIGLEIVTLWILSDPDQPAKGKSRLVFVNPSGEESELGQAEIDLTSFIRFRQTARIQGLPLKEPGRHIFRVEYANDADGDTQVVANIPLDIFIASE